MTELLANPPSSAIPPITSSVSLTTTTRSSSGSLTSSSSNSRPLSLEDELDQDELERKSSTTGFWLFNRKSSDQGYLKSSSSNDSFGTMQRSPRHFSFEELNNAAIIKSNSLKQSTLSTDSTQRMQREGSQSSLSTIFRKDFWKGGTVTNRNPLLNFNSDPSLLSSSAIQRKGSAASLVQPSPSSSTDTHHFQLRKLMPSHPLDDSSTPLTEIPSFNWDQ